MGGLFQKNSRVFGNLFNSFKQPERAFFFLGILLILFASVMGFLPAKAAFNEQINYQGKITDSAGVAVANGGYNIEFKLYTAASGGSAIWTETLSGDNRATTTNGLFSHLLGSITALDDSVFNQSLWLGVNVGGTTTVPVWDGEMTPRKKFGAVASAFEAKRLGGKLETAFGTLAENETLTGNWTVNATFTIATSSVGSALTITQSGSGYGATITGGNVGIGTATPNATLQVVGNIRSTSVTTTDFWANYATTSNLVATGTASTTYLISASTTLRGDTLFVNATGSSLAITAGPVIFPADSIATTSLANGDITYIAGSGLTGGGINYLGGSVTIDLGTATGLTVGADTVAVNYGATANTAVQGNTQITITAGTNLSGGGTITLGSGGTVTLNASASPTYTDIATTNATSSILAITNYASTSLLYVSATSTFSGPLIVNASASLNGTTSVNSIFNVVSTTTLASTTINGKLLVNNTTTITGGLNVADTIQYTTAGNNYLFVANSQTDYLKWDNANTKFVFTKGLDISGMVTSTRMMVNDSTAAYQTGLMGIGTSTPYAVLDVVGAIRFATFTTPTNALNGMTFYNQTDNKFKCYEGGAWKDCITAAAAGTIDGSGTADQLAFWNDSNTLAGDTALQWNSTTNVLTVTNASTTNLTVSNLSWLATTTISGDLSIDPNTDSNQVLYVGASTTIGSNAIYLDGASGTNGSKIDHVDFNSNLLQFDYVDGADINFINSGIGNFDTRLTFSSQPKTGSFGIGHHYLDDSFYIANSSAYNGKGIIMATSSRIGINTSTPLTAFSIVSTSTDPIFSIYTSTTNPTTSLYVNNIGLVGINTSSPAYTLDIDGSLRIAPISAIPANNNGVMYYDSTTNKFKCYENGSWKNCVGDTTGGDANSMQIRVDATTLGGSEVYWLDKGYLGIGTSSPTSTMTISTSTATTTLAIEADTNSANYSAQILFNWGKPVQSYFAMGLNANASQKFQLNPVKLVGTNPAFEMDSSGNIGIATSSDSSYDLKVGGTGIYVDNFVATGTISFNNGPNIVGTTTLVIGSLQVSNGDIYYWGVLVDMNPDLAERFPTNDSSLESGDIVASDPDNPEGITKSSKAYQENIMGAITTKPGIILGGLAGAGKDVALTGRIPVKVNLENGVIKSGDYITASSIPGIGMKAVKAGRVIGMAMEQFTQQEASEGKDRIVVFVNPHWMGNDLSAVQSPSGQIISTDIDQLKANLIKLGLALKDDGTLEVKNIKSEKIITSEFETKDKATGNTYCIWIENGDWKKEIGECQNISADTGNSGGSNPLPPDGNMTSTEPVSPDVAGTSTQETEPAANPPVQENPAPEPEPAVPAQEPAPQPEAIAPAESLAPETPAPETPAPPLPVE